MNLGQRLKTLRKRLMLSQEAVGAQGFVSTPGWIKIENNQRLPSDKLVTQFVKWLVQDKYLPGGDQERLREELLTLKYLNHRSEFVRALAKNHHETTDAGKSVEIAAPSGDASTRGRRGGGGGGAGSGGGSTGGSKGGGAKSAASGKSSGGSSKGGKGGRR